jgi:molybdopterin synthase sulfur carrier subunit
MLLASQIPRRQEGHVGTDMATIDEEKAMKIGLTGNLRRYVDFDFDIVLDASTVLDGLRRLSESYPAVSPVLFDAEGNVRSVHRVALNGSLLEVDDLERAIGPSDEVVILTPITGG